MFINLELAASPKSDFTIKFEKTGIYTVNCEIIELKTNDGRTMLGVKFTEVGCPNNQHVEPIYDNSNLVKGTKFEKASYADMGKLVGLFNAEVNRSKNGTYVERRNAFRDKYLGGDNESGNNVLRYVSDKMNLSEFISSFIILQEIAIPVLKSETEVKNFLLKTKFEKSVKVKCIAIRKNDGTYELKVNLRGRSIADVSKAMQFNSTELNGNMLYEASTAIQSPEDEKNLIESQDLPKDSIDDIFGV